MKDSFDIFTEKLMTMASAGKRFLANANGKKIVVLLPIKEYNKMLNDLEDLEDIRLYDEAKKREEKSIPFEQYLTQRGKPTKY